MGFSSGGRVAVAPLLIFIHDTDIVDKAKLNSATFRFFSYFRSFFRCPSPPWKRLNTIVLFSGHFCYFPVFFLLAP